MLLWSGATGADEVVVRRPAMLLALGALVLGVTSCSDAGPAGAPLPATAPSTATASPSVRAEADAAEVPPVDQPVPEPAAPAPGAPGGGADDEPVGNGNPPGDPGPAADDQPVGGEPSSGDGASATDPVGTDPGATDPGSTGSGFTGPASPEPGRTGPGAAPAAPVLPAGFPVPPGARDISGSGLPAVFLGPPARTCLEFYRSALPAAGYTVIEVGVENIDISEFASLRFRGPTVARGTVTCLSDRLSVDTRS